MEGHRITIKLNTDKPIDDASLKLLAHRIEEEIIDTLGTDGYEVDFIDVSINLMDDIYTHYS